MIFFKKTFFFIGIIYFSFLLKLKKLVSREGEFFILRKFVKKNQITIDIGANIGRYSFELSNIVGKKGLVYAFEPMHKSYLTLLALIIMNDIKNIIPFNLALSDKSSFVRMIEFSSLGKKSYIFSTQTESRIVNNKKNSIIKHSIKLDDLKIKKKISFIKIDCEGSEMKVLKGGKNLIKVNKPVLLVENLDNKIPKYLKSFGYKEFFNNKKSRNKIFIHKENIKKILN
jgi:FkbM family methyltransferase